MIIISHCAPISNGASSLRSYFNGASKKQQEKGLMLGKRKMQDWNTDLNEIYYINTFLEKQLLQLFDIIHLHWKKNWNVDFN